MGAEMTVSIAAIITLVGFAVTLYNFSNGRKKDIQNEDAKMSEIREGIITLNIKSDSMCQSVQELRVETKTQLRELGDRQRAQEIALAEVKRDVKTAFEMIDGLRDDLK